MKIHCIECDKYCGEIRDATIRKGTTYLCLECNPPPPLPKEKYTDDYAVNMLKNMLGIRS